MDTDPDEYKAYYSCGCITAKAVIHYIKHSNLFIFTTSS